MFSIKQTTNTAILVLYSPGVCVSLGSSHVHSPVDADVVDQSVHPVRLGVRGVHRQVEPVMRVTVDFYFVIYFITAIFLYFDF